MPVIPTNYKRSINRKIMIQAAPGIKQDPITEAKRAAGAGHVVEHLPSKFKALSSNPSTAKKKDILN
jgi:hypothetical protein